MAVRIPEPVCYIADTRATYDALGYPPYRWVHSDTPPAFAPFTKPLSQCRVGLIASGGVYQTGQVAFHHADDASFRIISADARTDDLRATHFAYDLTDARADINCVFPIDTLRALAADGVIGGVAPELYAFMGGIYSARRVREELAPALTERIAALDLDVVLLVPV